MFRLIKNIFTPKQTTLLGRWKLKTCDELTTKINSIYQNRDHCGDIICKKPVKPDKYYDQKKNEIII